MNKLYISFLFTHITIGTDLETWWDTESADNIGFGHHNCGFYVARVCSKPLFCHLSGKVDRNCNSNACFDLWYNLHIGRLYLSKS